MCFVALAPLAAMAASAASTAGAAIAAGASAIGSAAVAAGSAIGTAASAAGSFVAANSGAFMLGSSLLSAGMSAYQASEQASAIKKQAQYQAQVDANNAKMAEYARSDALQRGEIEAQRSMQSRAQLIGKQRAALAANGVDPNQGSALDLLASTEYLGQQEVDTIQNNALREAWGYSNQAADFRSSSAFADLRARNTSPGKAALLSGASSLIGSASQFAMMKAR